MRRLPTLVAWLVLLLPIGVSAAGEQARLLASFVIEAPAALDPRHLGALEQLARFPTREVDSIDRLRHPLYETCWYLLRWERPADARDDAWFRTSSLHQRHTEAYLMIDGRVVRSASAGYGVRGVGHDWSTEGLDLALSLAGVPAGRFDVLLRVQPTAPPLLLPEVVSTEDLRNAAVASWSISFVYYGGVIFLSLVQVVLLLHFRDHVSRDYALFAAGMCLGALARYGHFDALFSHRLGGFLLGDYLLHIRCLNTILGLRALCSYFDLAVNMPRARKVALGIVWLHVGLLVFASLLGNYWIDLISAPLRIGVLVFAVAVCGHAVRRDLIGARVAALAWVGVIATDLMLMTMLQGWITPFSKAPLLTIAGVLWELLFNTFALVYRFDRVRDLRKKVEIKETEARSFQRLLRVLCHDVSNPLSAIRFTLDAIDPKGPFRTSTLDLGAAVQRMRQAETTIASIIENVRAHEAVGQFGQSLSTRPVDLGRCLDETLEQFAARLAGKAIRVERDEPDGPIWVAAEPNLLKTTVLANALSNALKFSPQGGVVRVTVRRDGPDHVQVRITDRGAGIAPDVLKAFQESGKIASRPGTGGEAGTGFGLRLMRDYVGLMGGRFMLHSVSAADDPLRSGTTVELELRAASAPASPDVAA